MNEMTKLQLKCIGALVGYGGLLTIAASMGLIGWNTAINNMAFLLGPITIVSLAPILTK